MKLGRLVASCSLLLFAFASTASANALVSSIVPTDGGCIAGPSGSPSTSQKYDVELGKTYLVTLTGVNECGSGGTDPTINVRVNGISQTEPQNAELIATLVAPGTYQFTFTVPLTASCTLPIYYCTTPGVSSSGQFAWRSDGIHKMVHFRASTWGPGCTNPVEIQGDNCRTTPTRSSTWGVVKSIYR